MSLPPWASVEPSHLRLIKWFNSFLITKWWLIQLQFEKWLSSQIQDSAPIYGLAVKFFLSFFLIKKKKKLSSKKFHLASQGFPISKVICSLRAIINMFFSFFFFPYPLLALTQQSCFISCSHKFYLGRQCFKISGGK